MIVVNNLSFRYLPHLPPVFTKLDLAIDNLSWVALIGPDGSGKTTLAKLIKGFLTADSGFINFDPAGSVGCADIGYIGGDPYDSLVGISVEEDIIFGLENFCFSVPEIKTRLARALSWTGLTGMEKRLVHTLSGGEQQRLALAGVLATGARIFILDEALAMLDRLAREAIRSLLGMLRHDPGATIIEITQNLDEALQTDRVLFLSEGSIHFDGCPEDFFSSPFGNLWSSMTPGLAGLMGEMQREGVALDGNVKISEFRNFLINSFKA